MSNVLCCQTWVHVKDDKRGVSKLWRQSRIILIRSKGSEAHASYSNGLFLKKSMMNVVGAIISHGIICTSANFSLPAQYCRILSSLSMTSNRISMYISNVSKAFNLSNVGIKNVILKLKM